MVGTRSGYLMQTGVFQYPVEEQTDAWHMGHLLGHGQIEPLRTGFTLFLTAFFADFSGEDFFVF